MAQSCIRDMRLQDQKALHSLVVHNTKQMKEKLEEQVDVNEKISAKLDDHADAHKVCDVSCRCAWLPPCPRCTACPLFSVQLSPAPKPKSAKLLSGITG